MTVIRLRQQTCKTIKTITRLKEMAKANVKAFLKKLSNYLVKQA